jgi:hypothetical protein
MEPKYVVQVLFQKKWADLDTEHSDILEAREELAIARKEHKNCCFRIKKIEVEY